MTVQSSKISSYGATSPPTPPHTLLGGDHIIWGRSSCSKCMVTGSPICKSFFLACWWFGGLSFQVMLYLRRVFISIMWYVYTSLPRIPGNWYPKELRNKVPIRFKRLILIVESDGGGLAFYTAQLKSRLTYYVLANIRYLLCIGMNDTCVWDLNWYLSETA